MNTGTRAVRCLALVVASFGISAMPLAAQAGSPSPSAGSAPRALIALFEPAGQKGDATLGAALATVADSVELDLVCLQRFDVRRLPAVDPTRQMDRVRSYCQANRIDQAILGSGSARAPGGYSFRLMLYDRKSDSVTLVQEGACTGALDMFDTTDSLVAALLDKLSGAHVLFGSLVVETAPVGAIVSVNGKEVGPSPLSLRGLPVGAVSVSAQAPGWEEASAEVNVEDNQAATTSLSLARSQGKIALDVPDDAQVTVHTTGMEDRILLGAESEALPTGRYELSAACPGLPTVTQSLAVARNATSTWMPWKKGYLEVRSEVEGASVSVDGVARGVLPVVLELDPGVLHRLEVRKDKYELYLADVSAPAARKVSFEPPLTLKPGSLQVETTPAGAWVRLDDGGMERTPFTFTGVPAGTHTIRVDDLLLFKRYYTSAGKFTVEVNPDEQTSFAQTLVPGTGHLSVTAVPPGGAVTVDGSPVDTARVATVEGLEVPAGSLDITVTAPSGQVWKRTAVVGCGSVLRFATRDALDASLARRTIKVDGRTDDWEGILPTWEVAKLSDPFPQQPGTEVTRAYLCRDDHNIYLRMDFDDGTPLSGSLTSDVKATLCYEIHVVNNGLQIIANVNSSRQWGTNTWLGVWNESTRSSSNISNSLAYSIKGNSLELALPWRFVEGYLKDRPLSATIDVVDSGDKGWIKYWQSGPLTIDFVH